MNKFLQGIIAVVVLLAIRSAVFDLRVRARYSDAGVSRRPVSEVHLPTIASVTVINLPQSSDRWERFRSTYAAHPVPNIAVSDIHRLSAIDPRLAERFGWRSKYENGIVGCALSHVKALRRIARRRGGLEIDTDGGRNSSGSTNLPERRRWHLVCEDDATGNFTALADLLRKKHIPSERTVAINLFSPKFSFKYEVSASIARLRYRTNNMLHVSGDHDQATVGDSYPSASLMTTHDVPAPGFGTRMTAYLVTIEGARWMLSVLSNLEETALEVMKGSSKGNRTKIGDHPADLIPVDVTMARSIGSFWKAASYRGGKDSYVTGQIRPSGDQSTYAAGVVRPGRRRNVRRG
mmetsp:Transcript_44724/g.136463  ORF Transcript_44724/g.136463 Transcript_44724/m.136463 type:complete len:349 (-) Transcript_44724:166-1212(-)